MILKSSIALLGFFFVKSLTRTVAPVSFDYYEITSPVRKVPNSGDVLPNQNIHPLASTLTTPVVRLNHGGSENVHKFIPEKVLQTPLAFSYNTGGDAIIFPTTLYGTIANDKPRLLQGYSSAAPFGNGNVDTRVHSADTLRGATKYGTDITADIPYLNGDIGELNPEQKIAQPQTYYRHSDGRYVNVQGDERHTEAINESPEYSNNQQVLEEFRPAQPYSNDDNSEISTDTGDVQASSGTYHGSDGEYIAPVASYADHQIEDPGLEESLHGAGDPSYEDANNGRYIYAEDLKPVTFSDDSERRRSDEDESSKTYTDEGTRRPVEDLRVLPHLEDAGTSEYVDSSGDEKHSSSEDLKSAASHGGGHKKKSSKYKKGGGKEHHSDHHQSHGEKGDKGYKGHHDYEKGEKGHHDKEGHKGSYKDEGGKSHKHHDEHGFKAEHHTEHKAEKGGNFVEEGKHDKGHSTKGGHNIHKKDEYEKKHEFFDEYYEDGDNEKHGGFHSEHDYKKGGSEKGSHHKGGEHEDHYGKKGETEKGSHFSDHKGHKNEAGHDEHHEHEEKYGKKGGKHSGKKWGYKKGSGGGGGGHKSGGLTHGAASSGSAKIVEYSDDNKTLGTQHEQLIVESPPFVQIQSHEGDSRNGPVTFRKENYEIGHVPQSYNINEEENNHENNREPLVFQPELAQDRRDREEYIEPASSYENIDNDDESDDNSHRESANLDQQYSKIHPAITEKDDERYEQSSNQKRYVDNISVSSKQQTNVLLPQAQIVTTHSTKPKRQIKLLIIDPIRHDKRKRYYNPNKPLRKRCGNPRHYEHGNRYAKHLPYLSNPSDINNLSELPYKRVHPEEHNERNKRIIVPNIQSNNEDVQQQQNYNSNGGGVNDNINNNCTCIC